MKEILQSNAENQTFTLHLVCAQKYHDSPRNNMPQNNNTQPNRQQQQQQQQQQPTNDGLTRNDNSYFNTVSFANLPQQFLYQYVPQQSSHQIPLTPEQIQQMTMLQQAYAQYVAAQYYGHNANPLIQNQIPQVNIHPFGQVQQPVNQPVEQAVIQPEVQEPQIQRINVAPAGGAPENEDEDRDWLDWFYFISRAIVLFSIVYFYSSFNRFLMVIILAVTFYIYQNGWGNRQNRNQQIDVNVNANNNNNNRNGFQNANLTNGQEPIVHDQEHENQDQNEIPRTHLTERFPTLRLCWVIVSSLFTSLIPDQAPPVNLN